MGFDKEIQFVGDYGTYGQQLPGGKGPYRPYSDAWAAGFWQAFGAGKTIYEALDAASAYEFALSTTPDDGYRPWNIRIRQHPGAPSELRAVSGQAAGGATGRLAQIRSAGTGATLAFDAPGQRSSVLDRVLSRFLHRRVAKSLRWVAQPSPTGHHYAASIPQVGLFVVNRSAREVSQATFDLPRPTPHGTVVPTAGRRASAFLRRHSASHSGLKLRRQKTGGTAGARERQFLWQARRHGVWLPTYTSVTVRADGRVASYSHESSRLKAPLKPKISRQAAARAALQLADAATGTTAQVHQLTVRDLRPGTQNLVWDVWLRPPGGIPTVTVIWIDAATGKPA